jgi:hypothetical protein
VIPKTKKGLKLKFSCKSSVAIICVILVVFSSISVVKAQTTRVMKNFSGTVDSYFLHGGMQAYTYNVSMSVETESNGEWVVDNSYQITWRISIVNFSPDAIKEPSNLSLTFYAPVVGISGKQRTIISQTSVTIRQDGFLKVEFTPDKPVNQALVRTTLMENENYNSQEQFKNGYWNQNFDIWINIVDSLVTLPPVTASPITSPSVTQPPVSILNNVNFLILLVAIAILSIIAVLVFLYKSSKKIM